MGTSAPVIRLWTAVLFGYLALGATLQELPGYVAERFHADPLIVGITVGTAFAGTAVTRPFAGWAGDAGWSRPVAATGAALTSLAALGHLLAPSVGVLLVGRLVMGIGEAALFSATLPWILSAVAPAHVGRMAGWFGLSMWGGLSAGPLLAVGVWEAGGASAVWLLVVGLPVVSTVLVLSTRQAPPAPPPRIRGLRDLVPQGVGVPGTVLGLAAYGYGTLTALLVLFLGTAPLTSADLGLAGFAVAFLGARAFGSPVVDRLGAVTVVRAVLVVECVGFVLLAEAGNNATALAAVAVIGLGMGVIYPATSKLTLGRSAPRSAGAAMGAMTSLWDVGILVAGGLGGLLATHVGYRPAFWVAAGSALAAATCVARTPTAVAPAA